MHFLVIREFKGKLFTEMDAEFSISAVLEVFFNGIGNW